MALEAVVFPQALFGHGSKELYNQLQGGNWSYDFGIDDDQREDHDKGCSYNILQNQAESFLPGGDDWNPPPTSLLPDFINDLHQYNHIPSPDNGSTPGATHDLHQLDIASASASPAATRSKRRRSRNRKNKEEIENQRMTHIAVERNRRKQMNEYLSVLRSLMPESYVQRGDQASIIGGAINFVKELEQRLLAVGARKEMEEKPDGGHDPLQTFSNFFTFPQYSSTGSSTGSSSMAATNETMNETQYSSIADVEVTMVESHANLKIRSKRRPKQLLKLVAGLHSMRLTILHLNVTTVDQTVLYSLSVKVEDDCKLTSVEEIATAVYQTVGRIQEDCIMN